VRKSPIKKQGGKVMAIKELKLLQFTKLNAGSYRYGKWSIEKYDGAWLVRSSQFYSEHTTWENTLKGAKQYIERMEAM
jgi:hypothetical protein